MIVAKIVSEIQERKGDSNAPKTVSAVIMLGRDSGCATIEDLPENEAKSLALSRFIEEAYDVHGYFIPDTKKDQEVEILTFNNPAAMIDELDLAWNCTRIGETKPIPETDWSFRSIFFPPQETAHVQLQEIGENTISNELTPVSLSLGQVGNLTAGSN